MCIKRWLFRSSYQVYSMVMSADLSKLHIALMRIAHTRLLEESRYFKRCGGLRWLVGRHMSMSALHTKGNRVRSMDSDAWSVWIDCVNRLFFIFGLELIFKYIIYEWKIS